MIPAPAHPDPLTRLRLIVAALRGPGGCPWDREQTHATLRPHLLEEAYEVVDAIQRESDDDIREELGDFLLQVMLHAQIAEEAGRFDVNAVAEAICEKLVRRHPHVFGEDVASDSSAVLQRWEQIKREEKAGKSTAPTSALDGITRGLPALMRAEKMQKKAARVGFDWPDAQGALAKLREEIEELEAAINAGTADDIEDELGDLLFSAVNVARKVKCDAEVALTRSSEKFAKRFRAVEASVQAEGREVQDCSLAELDATWDRVKAHLDATRARV